jgi:glycosyltransferase involved in cell wall biosynthesis
MARAKSSVIDAELVISTYNNPRSLALCLESVRLQTAKLHGICIADDGSGSSTAAVVAAFQAANPAITLRHVWHEDRGFEKGAILNKAIQSATATFLVFIDGDVMIHPAFVARHLALARRQRFSTGSLIRLDAAATATVTAEMIGDGSVFNAGWLRSHRAIDRLGTWLKTMPFPLVVQRLLDRLTPVRRALCGANWSAFREDILAVNGYDETIKYGGQDKELGIRLENAGVLGRHLRYTAPLVHLDHPRAYADPAKMRRHKEMIRMARMSGQSWTASGIRKTAAP